MAIREGQPMTTGDYLGRIRQALASRDGISKPKSSQLAEADVYASAATAHALDRIATALETLAADVAPEFGTVQSAIHHSA